MKLLLDTCVSGALRQPLTEAGHDVIRINFIGKGTPAGSLR